MGFLAVINPRRKFGAHKKELWTINLILRAFPPERGSLSILKTLRKPYIF